ncbi:MAG: hypothetical protein M3O26_01645 [Pseudomonadota bacterium]|nr:hypothetical protein [Pseudomonadota bacterium]
MAADRLHALKPRQVVTEERVTERDGPTVQFQDRVSTEPETYQVRSAVPVLYFRDAPEASAAIDRGASTCSQR